jgi:hypothetical protein
MSVWPEERLRERVHEAGGPVTSAVPDLLAAFGARRFTRRACRNIEAALAQVGLEANPPLASAGPTGRVEISHRPGGAATSSNTQVQRAPAPPATVEGRMETRQGSVRVDDVVEAAGRAVSQAVDRAHTEIDLRLAAPLALAAAMIAVIMIIATTR